MIEKPARRVALCWRRVDAEIPQIEAIDQRVTVIPVFWISEAPDDVDGIVYQGCAVKIGRRKHVCRVPKYLDRGVGTNEHHVIVDIKIRIVAVLVFSAYVDKENGAFTVRGQKCGVLVWESRLEDALEFWRSR